MIDLNPNAPVPGSPAIAIPEEQLAAALEMGFPLERMIDPPAKAGTLRVVVADKSSGQAGSLRIPLAATPSPR